VIRDLFLPESRQRTEVLANSHAEKGVFIGPTKTSAYTRENSK
jgi:hypothetical protein